MMARRSQILRSAADRFFDKSPKRIFSEIDLRKILDQYRGEWRVPASLTVGRFIEMLLKSRALREVTIENVNYAKPAVTRYVREPVSPLQIATSIRPRAYLSHGSAVFVHAVTNQLPKTIYINVEQSPKPQRARQLTQAGIDRAFSAKQRESNLPLPI